MYGRMDEQDCPFYAEICSIQVTNVHVALPQDLGTGDRKIALTLYHSYSILTTYLFALILSDFCEWNVLYYCRNIKLLVKMI